MLVFGEGSLVDQLSWDPASSCGEDTEGITTFTNHSEYGLFGGEWHVCFISLPSP